MQIGILYPYDEKKMEQEKGKEASLGLQANSVYFDIQRLRLATGNNWEQIVLNLEHDLAKILGIIPQEETPQEENPQEEGSTPEEEAEEELFNPKPPEEETEGVELPKLDGGVLNA